MNYPLRDEARNFVLIKADQKFSIECIGPYLMGVTGLKGWPVVLSDGQYDILNFVI